MSNVQRIRGGNLGFDLPRGAKRTATQQLALNDEARADLQKMLSNIAVPEGWDIDLGESLEISNKPTEARLKEMQRNLKYGYGDLTLDQTADLVELLDSEKAGYFSMSKDAIVKLAVSNGAVKLRRSSDNTISQIEIDVELSNGALKLTTTDSEMADYMRGISDIEKFSKNHKIPENVDLKDFKIRIVSTGAKFAKLYRKYGNSSKSESHIAKYTLGVNIGMPRPNGTVGTTMLLNNDLLRENRDIDVKFVTRMSDTMTHEFSHSIQNGISFSFNRDYRKLGYMDAYSEFITDYGLTKPGEHFSDSMAKYIQTEKATPTFMDFLRSVGVL